MIAKKFTKRLKFKNWPNHNIPSVAAGAYVIWQGGELLYAGMSGREIEKAIKNGKKKYGLSTRLASHASGRLSGDPFCAFVSNRIIIPEIKQNQLNKFKNGLVTLDQVTKKFIRTTGISKLVIIKFLAGSSQKIKSFAVHTTVSLGNC